MLKFGPDGKLYVVIGDNGRRGWMQNLPCCPTRTCPDPSSLTISSADPRPTTRTPQDALSRLFVLPGSFHKDPELSWKFEVGATLTLRGITPIAYDTA